MRMVADYTVGLVIVIGHLLLIAIMERRQADALTAPDAR